MILVGHFQLGIFCASKRTLSFLVDPSHSHSFPLPPLEMELVSELFLLLFLLSLIPKNAACVSLSPVPGRVLGWGAPFLTGFGVCQSC